MVDLLWGACPTHENPCPLPTELAPGRFLFSMNPALLASAESEPSPRHLELRPKRNTGFPWGRTCKMEARTLWVAIFGYAERGGETDRQTEKQLPREKQKQGEWFLVGSHPPVLVFPGTWMPSCPLVLRDSPISLC